MRDINKVNFTIHGKPFAKQRPKFSRATGNAYTPKETVSFEDVIRNVAAPLFGEPMVGPVHVLVRAFFKIPKSWKKQEKADALEQVYHTNKPDFDNIAKAITDGLNRLAFIDDSQVAFCAVIKVWVLGDPKTVVEVSKLAYRNSPICFYTGEEPLTPNDE